MKIARLCFVILALTATVLSAAPKKKGGTFVHVESKSACEYYYYCYSNPSNIVDCCNTSCNCRGACDSACGGACDWDGSCIIA